MSALEHAGGTPGARRPDGRRPLSGRTRRIGLALFFASVSINAALGIYAVLAPSFGTTQGRILGTSLCVTGAVLVALACEPAWERLLVGPVPQLAAAFGGAGFTLAIATIWTEPESDAWANAMTTSFAFAGAGVAASLLALARLAPRHAWLQRVTYTLLGLAAALYAVLPWLGDDPSEWFVRTLGAVMVALAAFAVSVPVVHWIDRGTLAAALASAEVRFCPHCGRGLDGEVGVPLSCLRCGRDFTVSRSVPSPANLT